MKKTRALLLVTGLFIGFNNCIYSQPVSKADGQARSVAMILKISGENKVPKSTEIKSWNYFNGIAKNLNAHKPVTTNDIVEVKVFDEAEQVIYDAYFENPLNRKLESFEENGAVNNNTIPGQAGYVNTRFRIGNSSNVTIKCYTFKDDQPVLFSTYKFKGQ